MGKDMVLKGRAMDRDTAALKDRVGFVPGAVNSMVRI
jgi:hypothetical protein